MRIMVEPDKKVIYTDGLHKGIVEILSSSSKTKVC